MEPVISNWDELITVIKQQPTYFSAKDLKALRWTHKALQAFRKQVIARKIELWNGGMTKTQH